MELGKDFLEKQKQTLLEQKNTLEAEIKKLQKYPDYGSDLDDNLQETGDYENNMFESATLESDLKRIKAALRAIEKGSYGICPNCHKTISEIQLKSNPEGGLCSTCEKQSRH